jgi:serine phosphatase RsbU (regulator of sigma subunit)
MLKNQERITVSEQYFSDQFRKRLTLYLFGSIGSLLAIIFGLDAFSRGEKTFGVVLITIALGTTLTMFLIKKAKDVTIPSYIMVGLMFIANFYLLLVVAVRDDTAHLWNYIAPPIFLFASNRRVGSVLIISLIVITILSFEFMPDTKDIYDTFYKARFYATFFTVIMLSYIYEFIRERTYLAFKQADQEKEEFLDQVLQQKEEIESQKNQLEDVNKVIAKTNHLLTNSINYAKHIQDSILPEINTFSNLFSNSFIYYQPRDIVSGDFYWFTEVENRKYAAVVDCTGHGVPGAFMSMIGCTLLNEIVLYRNVKSTSEILDHLDKRVIQTLNQSDYKSMDDGMDISIMCLDNKTKTVSLSLASQHCYLIKSDSVKRIEGNPYSIGGILSIDSKKEFESYSFAKKEIDRLYLTTDGYLDQFGGPANQKYMSQRFEKLILESTNVKISQQRNIIQNEMIDWMSYNPLKNAQIDDILVLGIDFSDQSSN